MKKGTSQSKSIIPPCHAEGYSKEVEEKGGQKGEGSRRTRQKKGRMVDTLSHMLIKQNSPKHTEEKKT